MRLRRRLLPVLIAIALVHPGWMAEAQRVAAQKRGVDAATAFVVDDLDSIGPFNGALTISILLGRDYPVGPGFSYGFQAVLNSVMWDFDPVTCTEGPYSMAVPDDRYNAGHSWFVSFGEIEFVGTHWRFVSPSGSQHGLYPRLHPGTPATPPSGVYYSTSSTYFRFRHFPQGSALCSSPGECGLLHFRNGQVHEFHPRTVDGKTVYLPTRLSDAHDNWVAISYPAAGTTWEVIDSHGRSHTIAFGGPAGNYRRVTSLRLAKFGAGHATYSFQYDNITLERQSFVPQQCSSRNPTVPVVALSRIVFPDQSFYEMSYYETDDAPDVLSGGLSSIRLRGGGEYRYTYTPVFIGSQPVESENIPAPVVPDLQRAFGVATKEIALSVGAPAHGTWTYQYVADFPITVPGENGVPCHRRTIVRNPVGDESVHYFSTSVAHRWSYSLPFTRCGSGTYDTTPPFVSVETYDGSVATGTKVRSLYVEYEGDSLMTGNGSNSQEHNQRIKLQRTVYHDDEDATHQIEFSDFDGLGNYRTRVDTSFVATDTRTYFHNTNPENGTLIVDPETGSTAGSTFVLPAVGSLWVLDTFSEQTVTGAGSTARIEYCFDGATGFLERTRVLAGAARGNTDTLTVFEPEIGGGRPTGRVATEKVYGGASQGAMDAVYDSLCDMTLPAQPEYQTEHSYQAGVRATSTAVDPTCSPPTEVLSLLDRTIDTNTGLVSRSRDPAGVEAVFTYDVLGRLTAERPADSASITYTYQLPSLSEPNRPSQVTIKSCANGTTSCTTSESLTWERLEFDELGRQVGERLRVPEVSGLVEKVRTTTYNALGWKLTESMWGNAGRVTVFDNYDPFGRVGRTTPPGQPASEVFYEGERVKTRKTRVMLTPGLSDAYTTEIYDARGNLIRACEDQSTPWSGTCTGVETSYLYDVGDRLTRVCSDRQVSGGVTTCGQIRRFVYDHKGHLIQERHPEIGVLEGAGAFFSGEPIVDPDGFEEIAAMDAGNDWIFYTHDSRGNVLAKDVEGSTAFDLNFHYDAAGRLIRVEEDRSGNPRLLKEYFFASSNSGTDFRKGKLVLTKRHNWLAPPGSGQAETDAVISEAFRYEGLDGRLSARQTRYQHGGTTYAFNQSVSSDPLGHVATLTYPQCQHGEGGCSQAAPDRTVSHSRSKGYLTAIQGYAPGITYQAGGMLHTITFTSGVTYTVEINPADGLDRPYRISTSAGWDSGTFKYDGAGNITQVGPRLFRYDRLNRLVSGQVMVGGSLRTQTASYDVYGNITSLVTNGSVQSTSTSTATNRLLSPLGTYDGAGNLTRADFGSESYEYTYDGVNMTKTLKSDTGLERLFLYNADDERIAQFDCVIAGCDIGDTEQTWTIRGSGSEVLRVYTRHPDGGWKWKADYIHRSGTPLATETVQGVLHLHPDHLGTPRQITDASGSQESFHSYYPFGQEATNAAQDEVALKFTGHERDESSVNSMGVLDYMHARFCSYHLGRFLSVDPINTGRSSSAQSWNKYAYVVNNPLLRIDPDGRGDLLSIRAGGQPEKLVELVQKEGGTPGGTLLGMSLFVPGPEDLAIASFVTTKVGRGLATSFGRLLSRIFSKGQKIEKTITVSSSRFGEAAEHIRDAQSAGKPNVVTVDRRGSDPRRKMSMQGHPRVKGRDRDEYPPAMFKEGGAGSSVRPMNPSANRGCGSFIGNQCRGLEDGSKVRIEVTDE